MWPFSTLIFAVGFRRGFKRRHVQMSCYKTRQIAWGLYAGKLSQDSEDNRRGYEAMVLHCRRWVEHAVDNLGVPYDDEAEQRRQRHGQQRRQRHGQQLRGMGSSSGRGMGSSNDRHGQQQRQRHGQQQHESHGQQQHESHGQQQHESHGQQQHESHGQQQHESHGQQQHETAA
ncbi:hypothetical protein CLOP_g12008 [Closterium sp. NIES-67]|nr:hypothetical protein CLOP_g12008 [Closterium sp. NIES-67]